MYLNMYVLSDQIVNINRLLIIEWQTVMKINKANNYDSKIDKKKKSNQIKIN